MLVSNHVAIVSRSCALLGIAFAAPHPAEAQEPAWWSAAPTKIWQTSAVNTDNYAPINVGQLKHVATQAKNYLDLRLSLMGGAGDYIEDCVLNFTSTENYSPANVGQLKNVAKLFYDRLCQIPFDWQQPGTANVRPTQLYPWTGTTHAENSAPANVGQLKNLFSFVISDAHVADGDSDSLFDGWEYCYHWGTGGTPQSDGDGDGLTDLEEFRQGTDPTNPDSDFDGVTDRQEVLSSTNPNSDQSHPPVWRVIHRELEYDFDDYGAYSGTLSTSRSWNGTGGGGADSTEIDWPLLDDQFTLLSPPRQILFPSTPPVPTDTLAIAEGFAQTYIVPEPCYHATLGHARAWLEVKPAPLGDLTRTFLRVTDRIIDGTAAVPVVETVEVMIPANATISPPVDLLPAFTTEPPTPPVNQTELVIEKLLPLDIWPDDNMAGVMGDLVKSVTPWSSVKHFVTPKKTTQIPQDYVILKATGISAEHITAGHPHQVLEWDATVGEAVPNEPLKWRVRRDTTSRSIVRIKRKQGGTVSARIDVWVIWADVVAHVGQTAFSVHPPQYSAFETLNYYPLGWRFEFAITPASICDGTVGGHFPDLRGLKRKPVPGQAKQYVPAPAPPFQTADNAQRQWDVSRQMKVTLRNPGLIPKADLIPGFSPAMVANQPTPVDVPVDYPADDVEGNDDSHGHGLDEDDNPYQISNTQMAHQIAELASFDAPFPKAWNTWGAAGRTHSRESNFREFARVELWDGKRTTGKFWFRVSTHYEWHHYLHVTWDVATARWLDANSTTGGGHPIP